jgi:ABC-type spermidine/putrescine transport system permease subunit I
MIAVRLLLYVAFGLCLALVLGPIAVIIGISFSPIDGFVFPPTGLSLRWYASFRASEKLVDSLLFSFRMALTVAVLSLILGTFAALALARRRGLVAGSIQSMFMAPMVFPTIILGLAVLLFVRVIGAPLWLGLTVAHEKWPRLSEQLSPIYKWTAGGLQTVQSCPRWRSALATNRPPRWATRGAPWNSSYAAIATLGSLAK